MSAAEHAFIDKAAKELYVALDAKGIFASIENQDVYPCMFPPEVVELIGEHLRRFLVENWPKVQEVYP